MSDRPLDDDELPGIRASVMLDRTKETELVRRFLATVDQLQSERVCLRADFEAATVGCQLAIDESAEILVTQGVLSRRLAAVRSSMHALKEALDAGQ